MNEKELLDLRGFMTVAHHIPGRLRLKLNPEIRQHPVAALLGKLDAKESENGLISARVNLLARSLVIEYDKERISHEKITTFLTGSNPDEVRQAMSTIAGLFGITLSTQKEN